MKRLEKVEDLEALRTEAAKAESGVQRTILVCAGTGCLAGGAAEVADAFRHELQTREIDMDVELVVKQTGCHGFCERGPLVTFAPSGVMYQRVAKSMVSKIVDKTALGDQLIEEYLYHQPETDAPVPTYAEIPFYSHQTRLTLKNIGHIDPESLSDFLAADGFIGLTRALARPPAQVIDEVEASGLRGKGGGGFTTARKWRACAEAEGETRYLIANGDEGDPGAFMDRSLMEGDPFGVIEGMLIAAYGIGTKQGYIYVRKEYPLAVTRLQRAIAVCREIGLLGEQILGRDFDFDITIARGGGAFVCGEETALIASIEGRRGTPRPRPPYPAVRGLWGKPTVIQNVETLGSLPAILRDGASSYTRHGTPGSPGTKTFALVGKVNNTGLVEVPLGITLREMVYEIGGGIVGNKALKAVQTGGPSGGCIPADALDLPVDFASLTEAGSIMGSGGMIVLDEDTCMVDLARYFIAFTQEESCGKCPPCRVGTRVMLEILQAITEGRGTPADLDRLEQLALTVKDASLCGLGQTAPNPVLTTLRYFRDEYDEHILQHKCRALTCVSLVQYHIEPDRCIGCRICARACPVDAISGDKEQVHEIDAVKCIQCGNCLQVCPATAAAVYRTSGDLTRHEQPKQKSRGKAEGTAR